MIKNKEFFEEFAANRINELIGNNTIAERCDTIEDIQLVAETMYGGFIDLRNHLDSSSVADELFEGKSLCFSYDIGPMGNTLRLKTQTVFAVDKGIYIHIFKRNNNIDPRRLFANIKISKDFIIENFLSSRGRSVIALRDIV